RERVVDWITEDREHPGARGDHFAASDLSLATTGSSSFSMSPAAARYSATSPPNGSGMSFAPSVPAYSTIVAALSRPPRSNTRCRCAAVIVRIRSDSLTSSRVSSRARCPPRSRPRSRPTRYDPSDTGEPSHAEVPADDTCTFASAGCFAMPSARIAAASGDLHVLPEHTTRTLNSRLTAPTSPHGDAARAGELHLHERGVAPAWCSRRVSTAARCRAHRRRAPATHPSRSPHRTTPPHRTHRVQSHRRDDWRWWR